MLSSTLLDDLGYVQQSPDEAEFLFTLLAERYECRSVMVTSNRRADAQVLGIPAGGQGAGARAAGVTRHAPASLRLAVPRSDRIDYSGRPIRT